jgi:ankyrin repeat protein
MPTAQTRLEILQICKLLQCVREEDKEQIKKLVDSGVPLLINYNEPNEGETALTVAAAQNNDIMIQYLLELGAHPNVVDFKVSSLKIILVTFFHLFILQISIDNTMLNIIIVICNINNSEIRSGFVCIYHLL